MTTANAREALYHRLGEVIGVDNATTLMSYLPHDPPASLADVHHEILSSEERVKAEFRSEIRVVSGRMDLFDERMGRFEDRMDSFQSLLVVQARNYAISTVTTVVGTAALVLGIATII